MEHERRTSWTGRPRPRIRVRPPQGFSRLLQPGARLTDSSNFGPLSTTPASSWRRILERSSRRISDISNRFWVKNRTCRKQTIKPCLTGARTHIRIFEILQISAQNPAALHPQSHARFANFKAFLTETAQHSEFVVTSSKQTTGEFLTETRIACRHHLNSAPRRSNFKQVSQPVCGYNVIALPSAPSLFRRRFELHHNGKPEFGSNLARKISNSN
jgi:hypothetical protein